MASRWQASEESQVSYKKLLVRLEIFQLKMRRIKTRNWLTSPQDQGELATLESERDALRDEASTYAAANRDLQEPLTPQDRDVLLVMLGQKADIRKPVSRQDVADAIGGGDPKKVTQHLREEVLVGAKHGVGVYLTEKGWKLAESLSDGFCP